MITKDVVDEEQHVLALGVTEVLGDGQAGEGHAGAGTGRGLRAAIVAVTEVVDDLVNQDMFAHT